MKGLWKSGFWSENYESGFFQNEESDDGGVTWASPREKVKWASGPRKVLESFKIMVVD